MNAQAPVKVIKKIRNEKYKIIAGVRTITLDHNMEKHRIVSDNEALISDWKKVCLDIHKTLKVMHIEQL